MSQYVINTGNIANDGAGDPLRTAFQETNLNFNQVWAAGPVGSNIAIANNTIQVTNTNGNLILATNGIGVIKPAADFVPDYANVRMLGSPTRRFNTLYTQYLDVATANFSGNAFIGGNLYVDGNVITTGYSNLSVANSNITLAANAISPIQADGGGILLAGANANIVYSASGNNWNFNIDVDVNANVTANKFIGDGGLLTNVSAAVNAIDIGGTTLNDTVIYSNLTTVGTLANLSVLGDIVGNVIQGTFAGDGGNLVNIDGGAVSGNVNNANFATYAGTANTANLAAKAVYALDADRALLSVNSVLAGTANLAINANYANVANTALRATLANSAIVANVAIEALSVGTLANLSVTGNIVVGGILTNNYYYANGVPFSGNSSSNYGNANVAAYLPTYTGNLAGNQLTVTTVDALDISTTDFATTDLTSYGYAALSNVNATGNITAGGILTDNYYYANGEPFVSSVPGGNNTQVQYNANGVFAGSAGFTFNATANALVVNGGVSGQQLTATNGLVLNSRTIAQDFELDGYNASSVGPITTAPGVVVDITDGNWVIS
jgi:hypothetical protein